MEQLQALKELAEKVEVDIFPGDLTGPQMGFPDISAAYLYDAFSGSLDAAHSLHKAVLGDMWGWQVMPRLTKLIWADVASEVTVKGRVKPNDPPARAWLLAIIKAKIQELEQ